ncbi:MAG: choloylglycine hydrolase [Clostridia bacterium]|nr:choloylglycine hydrolase [Clostridia bacterium]
MCTAITYKTEENYFGRNLDLEYSYNETVTITPRNFPLKFRHNQTMVNHYAIIGMAYVVNDYPLYYDAINEKGVGIAGLNFPDNADYKEITNGKDNISSFEFIPWVLGRCKNLTEVKELIENVVITNEAFSKELLPTPLHWMICHNNKSIVVEQEKSGLKVYDNPVGILTNNPSFKYQLFWLNNYLNVTSNEANNRFCESISLEPYSNGMGGIGLPGDLSSASRFVRASFVKLNSTSGVSEKESISQCFHILSSVEQQRGSVYLDGKYEITVYSSCCNLDKGIYYYKTYENHRISAVDMNKENLESDALISYPLVTGEQILYIN